MDEKNLLDQIRQSASDLTPPESLSPDAIEKLLSQKTPAKSKKKKIFVFSRFAAAAAVFALCAVSFRQVQKIQKHSADLEKQMTENIVSQEASAKTADESGPEEISPAAASQPESAPVPSGESESSADIASADDSENISLLSPAQSYEEVYDALRKNFYYEEDIIYDINNDMGVLTASADAAAKSTATAGGGSLDGTAEIAAEDGTAEIAAAGSAEEGTAEDGSAEIAAAGSADEEGAAEYAVEDSAAEIAAVDAAEVMETPEATDYSATNIQEFGVDEADIVKTDGRYIYILRRNGSVTIVDAKEPQALKEVSTISPADSDLLGTEELYTDGDTLNVIATRQSTSLEQDGDVYYPSSTRQTVLYTYDISDRTAPKLAGTISQDGDYTTSRKNGSFIYLFTSWYPDLGETYAESRIIPTVNGADLDVSDFYLPKSLTSSSYLLISSVNTEDPQNILDKKALVSGTSNFYVSPENIYIANENWKLNTTMTDIMKFHYKDGKITGTAAGSVKGYLNNSFSLNEYNGFLRVVSTYYDDSGEEQNGLYILDDSLHITGSIEDLAEGETIRSARFFGNIGYFVTFRQTDPLFSADLSDPASPVVLGELKVSGFSSYLHFYGQDLLLGMGYEADEQTGFISGVKLSMFDVSDPANVTELHRLVIPGVTWCPSIKNYKSILIDPQKNVFGFFCSDHYLVFSYDKEKGFVSELIYDFIQDALSGQTQTPESDSSAGNSSNGTPADESSSETGETSDDSSAETGETSDDASPETGEASDDGFLLLDKDDKSDPVDTNQSVPEFDIMINDSAYYPAISADNTRGLYIGDTFFLAGDTSVTAFDMADSYSPLGRLPLL